jgi:lysozyme
MDVSNYTQVPYDSIYANLKDEEGERLVAYTDTRGYTTVGIGHCCSSNPVKPIIGRDVKVGQSISPIESEKIFNHDLLGVLNDLQKLSFFKSLTESQQYVLISLAWNLGFPGLTKFRHFLDALEAHEVDEAVKELKNSRWFHQVPNRANKLIKLLES